MELNWLYECVYTFSFRDSFSFVTENMVIMPNSLSHKQLKQQIAQDIKPYAFWSYGSSELSDISDDRLIEAVLIYGDDHLRLQLLELYNFQKVQQVWEEKLVIRGSYFKELNRKIASDLLRIPNPKAFIRESYKKNNLYDRFSA